MRDLVADLLPVVPTVDRLEHPLIERAGVEAPGIVRVDRQALSAHALQHGLCVPRITGTVLQTDHVISGHGIQCCHQLSLRAIQMAGHVIQSTSCAWLSHQTNVLIP